MNATNLDPIREMLMAAQQIEESLADCDAIEFSATPHRRFAIARLLIIVGTAAEQVDIPIRLEQPAIPWGRFIALKEDLSSAHDEVGTDELWYVVEHDIFVLVGVLESVLAEHVR